MAENKIQTRSRVVRSPPAVQNVIGQTTSSTKPPVQPREEDSSPEISFLGGFGGFGPNPNQTPTSIGHPLPLAAVTARDDGAILLLLQNIQNMVSGLDVKFTSKFDDLSRSVSVVQQDVASVRKELSDVVASKLTKHSEQLSTHETRLNDVEASIRELRNSAEAATKAADLIIKGIPVLSGDNPVKLYLGVAAALGFEGNTAPAAEIFRLGKKKVGSSFDPPILVKFARILDKNEFFRRYFRHKNLNLTEIGFSVNQRIFITENLTKQDQEIHATAMKLRNEQKLLSVSTSRGVVLVRRHKEERPFPVRMVSELMELVGAAAENEENHEDDGQK
jgi:hypothetical protein